MSLPRRRSSRPATRLAAALATSALVACGSSAGPIANPGAMVGTYDVTVTANDIDDPDVMTVVLGSGTDVLLTFTYGFTPIRAEVAGSTMLTLPRQDIDASHATGPADGLASGSGTIDATGAVDITVNLSTVGFTQPDGGTGSDAVDYHVTGQKQPAM